jgi:hypothetical protein
MRPFASYGRRHSPAAVLRTMASVAAMSFALMFLSMLLYPTYIAAASRGALSHQFTRLIADGSLNACAGLDDWRLQNRWISECRIVRIDASARVVHAVCPEATPLDVRFQPRSESVTVGTLLGFNFNLEPVSITLRGATAWRCVVK